MLRAYKARSLEVCALKIQLGAPHGRPPPLPKAHLGECVASMLLNAQNLCPALLDSDILSEPSPEVRDCVVITQSESLYCILEQKESEDGHDHQECAYERNTPPVHDSSLERDKRRHWPREWIHLFYLLSRQREEIICTIYLSKSFVK